MVRKLGQLKWIRSNWLNILLEVPQISPRADGAATIIFVLLKGHRNPLPLGYILYPNGVNDGVSHLLGSCLRRRLSHHGQFDAGVDQAVLRAIAANCASVAVVVSLDQPGDHGPVAHVHELGVGP